VSFEVTQVVLKKVLHELVYVKILILVLLMTKWAVSGRGRIDPWMSRIIEMAGRLDSEHPLGG
jgi:hypothetical protein